MTTAVITGTRAGVAPSRRLYPSTTETFYNDLDLVAVEKAMNGETTELTADEKVYAAQLLHQRGHDFTDISRRLRCSRDTVSAWHKDNWVARQRAFLPPPEEDPIDIGAAKHGRSGYTKGCRCRVCRGAASAYSRARRDRLREMRQAA
ncbi:helix-turn-helix domain-containing protein [Streptomyces sp. NBC_00207]|uniref:helix-turn-helix domain-containing protein n=1 Tax=Streptomyces sp. NBC_00207 TaxID=2903635 RepID=UPI0032435D10